jgi:hypothetical protein
MATKHVFVETNWVVDSYAPRHLKVPAALELLKAANAGALSLHLPGLCLSEARSAIRRKFQPRNQADPIRTYLRWARSEGQLTPDADETVRRTLDTYENEVQNHLEHLEEAIAGARNEKGVSVFALTEEMHEKAITLSLEKLELQPFDSSILASILTRADQLRKADPQVEMCFCEMDGDLQPWDKNGKPKPILAGLYDESRVWVYSDFTMTSPERPPNWGS